LLLIAYLLSWRCQEHSENSFALSAWFHAKTSERVSGLYSYIEAERFHFQCKCICRVDFVCSQQYGRMVMKLKLAEGI